MKLVQCLESPSKNYFLIKKFISDFRQMQTVKLDKLIKLFDSPGIVMSKETNPASLILRNCVRVSEISNIQWCFNLTI